MDEVWQGGGGIGRDCWLMLAAIIVGTHTEVECGVGRRLAVILR